MYFQFGRDGNNDKIELGRVYKIGGKSILVPEKAVQKLIGWNEPAKRSDTQYDRKACYIWLLSLVEKDQLSAHNVDLEVMNFIKGDYIFTAIVTYF